MFSGGVETGEIGSQKVPDFLSHFVSTFPKCCRILKSIEREGVMVRNELIILLLSKIYLETAHDNSNGEELNYFFFLSFVFQGKR